MRRGASHHATAFGVVAEDYDRYRPEPSPEVLDWLLCPGDRDVLDLGAGTGQLTELLVERGATVTAVEPDAGMRRALEGRVPAARVLEGVAEDIPVGDRSQDAVLAHAAWHWFDARRAVAEAARVLRPGGRLGVLRTGFDPDIDWLGDLWARLEPDPSARRPGGRPRSPRLAAGLLARWRRARSFGHLGSPFERQETRVVTFRRQFSSSQLAGLMGTYSGLIVRSPAEREVIVGRVRELIGSDPRLGEGEGFEVGMVTYCWRADRRPARVGRPSHVDDR